MDESPHHLPDHEDLTSDEKAQIRSHVQAYMQQHPAADILQHNEKVEIRMALKEHIRLSAEEVLDQSSSVFDRFVVLLQMWSPRFAAVLFGVLFLGASATYASNSSLPGDYLYPVKVFMKETVPDAVARPTNKQVKKTKAEAQRSITRLEEAEQLLLRKDEQTEEVMEQVRTNTAKHIESVRAGVEALHNQGRSEDAKRVAEELEQALKERKETFKTLKEQTKDKWAETFEQDVDDVLLRVQSIKESVSEIEIPEVELPVIDNVPLPLPLPVFNSGGSSSLTSSSSFHSSESSASSVSSESYSSFQSSSLAASSASPVEEVIDVIDDIAPEPVDELLGL